MERPDQHDNLYQPPSTTFVTVEKVDEAQTSNGSYIKVGQRKKFTAAFGLMMLTVILIVMFLKIIVCVGGGAYVATTISPVLGFLIMFGGPIFGYVLMIPWYSGIAFADIVLKRRDSHAEEEFVVGMRFTPRLTALGPERVDGDDDTGVISPQTDFLVYKGDRIEARISRHDVRQIRTQRASMLKLGIIGPDVIVEFAQPILQCHRMKLVINEGKTTWKSARRAKELVRAMEEWFRHV
jgi:hypothetical protein